MFAVLGIEIFRGDVIQNLEQTCLFKISRTGEEIEVYNEDIFYNYSDAQYQRDENLKLILEGKNVNGVFLQ